MTRFQYINQNIDRVKNDIHIGLIPVSVLRHFEIYSRYDYYRRVGYNSRDSVLCVSFDLKLSEQWAYNVVKKMEEVI